MTEYALYVESGPKRRKTMVHVPALLGCMANGPTTEAALDATPEAITAFRRFLKRTGEDIDDEAPFTTAVAEHVTEGMWLGNGSPYVMFGPDFDPLPDDELELLTRRFLAMRAALADWAESQPDEALDAAPAEKGRTARAILLHVLGTPYAYVSAMVGGVPGASRLVTLVERGEVALPEGLRQIGTLVAERLRATTPEQRSAVEQHGQITRSLRKVIRRTLEHDWEHLAELSRRSGGPSLG